MKLRKGYVPRYETSEGFYVKEKRDCIIHGIFQWAFGADDAGPLAVVEFENGSVQEIEPVDVVFTEKPEG